MAAIQGKFTGSNRLFGRGEGLIQRIRLLACIYDIHNGMALGTIGIFEMIHSLINSDANKNQPEKRKKEGRTHADGTNGPDYTKDGGKN